MKRDYVLGLFCLAALALFAAPVAAQGGGGTMCSEEDEKSGKCTNVVGEMPKYDPCADTPWLCSGTLPPHPQWTPTPGLPTQPVIRPQTPEDKKADEENRRRQEEEERDRKTEECKAASLALSALQEHFLEIGKCDATFMGRKKRKACSDLAAKIDELVMKVARLC